MAEVKLEMSEYNALKQIEEDLRKALAKEEEVRKELKDAYADAENAWNEVKRIEKSNEKSVTFIAKTITEHIEFGSDIMSSLRSIIHEYDRSPFGSYSNSNAYESLNRLFVKRIVRTPETEEYVYSKPLAEVKAQIKQEAYKEVDKELEENKAYRAAEQARIKVFKDEIRELKSQMKDLERQRDTLLQRVNTQIDVSEQVFKRLEDMDEALEAILIDTRDNNRMFARLDCIARVNNTLKNAIIPDFENIHKTVKINVNVLKDFKKDFLDAKQRR